MKANQFANDDNAQVGIGTMIVFIATILVAAVAAGVLIDTSQKLQTKSTETGNAATEEVGTTLEVLSVTGERTATTDTELEILRVQVRLAAGAETVDPSAIVIQYRDGASIDQYDYVAGTTSSSTQFVATDVAGNAVTTIAAGDIVLLRLGADGDAVGVATADNVELDILPQVGHSVQVAFTAPSTFGRDLVFDLF